MQSLQPEVDTSNRVEDEGANPASSSVKIEGNGNIVIQEGIQSEELSQEEVTEETVETETPQEAVYAEEEVTEENQEVYEEATYEESSEDEYAESVEGGEASWEETEESYDGE